MPCPAPRSSRSPPIRSGLVSPDLHNILLSHPVLLFYNHNGLDSVSTETCFGQVTLARIFDEVVSNKDALRIRCVQIAVTLL
mmetsp:Transcript_76089/g.204169  ORF Transcript_76089/g.204169 Transcript_76089/m.204169 type:complete len:82 (+) Transcript_76089:856-1101(+)